MRNRRTWAVASFLLLVGSSFADPITVPDPPASVTKPAPESIADLKEFQAQTRAVVEKVRPSTVCLLVPNPSPGNPGSVASGSGVIVSKDGLILTAGHVSGTPDKPITIILPDGKRVKGKSLGQFRNIDSGMAKITDPGDWPYCEVGSSGDLKVGQWCVAIGHPEGYKVGRSPVVRVGRIGMNNDTAIQTDCTLVGGDSGGPLFDMKGRVIGIHSRIGPFLTANLHVPIDTYKESWDQLVRGDRIGDVAAYLGVQGDLDAKNACLLGAVTPDSPADKAGLRPGDKVLKFGKYSLKKYADLRRHLDYRKPGDDITLLVQRGDQEFELKATLSKRND